ncbi:MAG: hypothetical protein OHK0022_12200 [Roseiflexaceae bacterium]
MISAAVQCPICHSSSPPGATFCNTCGFVFGTEAPADDAPLCPRCGAAQRPGARMCGSCGAALLSSPTLLLGHRLNGGRYTVQRLLSRGGMGGIYLAVDHENNDQAVVIKTLRTMLTTGHVDDAYLQEQARLHHEGRLLGMSRHRYIPRLLNSFTDQDQIFLVMQHIDGDNLLTRLSHFDETRRQVIPGTPFSTEEVLQWGMMLCEVLEYLSAMTPAPIVHQDIKPANLVLDRIHDDLYLVDFGTAVQLGITEDDLAQPFGTPGYAPPEQYRGLIEPRSDVYGLASTLYHLLTDDDPADHPFQFPKLDELGALGELLRQALSQDVEQRPTANELRRRLEGLRDPRSMSLLRAPDGTRFTDIASLVTWCERHWGEATRWLYSTMPTQIERWHGPGLATELRAMSEHHDPHAALDAALALLDPHGFGATAPRLICATRVLEFAAGPRAIPQTLAIANTGRRYVRAQVSAPAWLVPSHPEIALPPGQKQTLTLTPRPGARLHARDALRLHDGKAPVLTCEIRAKRGWRRLLPW